jgi:hypothetical protein
MFGVLHCALKDVSSRQHSQLSTPPNKLHFLFSGALAASAAHKSIFAVFFLILSAGSTGDKGLVRHVPAFLPVSG